MTPAWYDRAGHPITDRQAEVLFTDPDYVDVARYEQDGYLVSTVWLGADENRTGEGPPILFETAIFDPSESVYCQRYPTEVAALAGHDQAVMRLRHEILPGGTS